MNQEFRIRPYEAADYTGLQEILKAGDLYSPAFDTEANIAKKVSQNPASILVASDGNQTVGCIFIQFDGWRATVARLAVDPKYRGHEFGGQLLQAAEQELRKQGATVVFLYIESDNHKLEQYYAGQGYKPKKTTLVMSKELA